MATEDEEQGDSLEQVVWQLQMLISSLQNVVTAVNNFNKDIVTSFSLITDSTGTNF